MRTIALLLLAGCGVGPVSERVPTWEGSPIRLDIKFDADPIGSPPSISRPVTPKRYLGVLGHSFRLR